MSDDGKGTGLKYKGGGHYDLPDGTSVKGKARAELALFKKALHSATTSRAEIARRAGIQYQGERDVYEVAGYIREGYEKFGTYWSYYERNEAAGRIVDIAPEWTWKKPPLVTEEGMDPEKPTPFVQDFNGVAERLRLWNRFQRGDTITRIGRYGVLLIGVPGEDRDLAQEMPMLSGPGDILYLSAFNEEEAKIDTWVTDPGDERFGQPLLYEIKITHGDKSSSTQMLKVHWSRIIHIAEDVLGDDVFGRPVLKRLLNTLFNLDKVSAGTGEAFWQLASRILVGSVAEGATISEPAMDELGENLQEIVHDLRRQFLGEGVDLKWLESMPPDPKAAADYFLSLLAIGSGIPKRILFGTETGERASEQDQRSFLGSIAARRKQHAEPVIVRAFTDRMIERGGFAAPQTEAGYEIVWPNLVEESNAEMAEANKNRSEAAKNLTGIGGNPIEIVTVDEEGNVWLKPTAQMEEEGLLDDDEDEPIDEGPPEALEEEEEEEEVVEEEEEEE